MNKMRYIRIAVAAAVLLIPFFATFAAVPVGTLCALCPVGFAEIAVAGGTVPWQLLPGVLIVLALVFLIGRFFCSWLCPTSFLRNIFGGRTPRGLTGRTGTCSECTSAGKNTGAAAPETTDSPYAVAAEIVGTADAAAGTSVAASTDNHAAAADASMPSTGKAASPAKPKRNHSSLASQGIVLAVLLVVSFFVHFPVFCLICPIGLAFGTVFAISRVFITWQPGWELLAFPAMLILEVFLLRRWCSAICPLGFFFGLMAKLHTKVPALPTPRADRRTCLYNQGCRTCATVCPENICDATATSHDMEDCTFCLDCAEHCPSKAIALAGNHPGSSTRSESRNK